MSSTGSVNSANNEKIDHNSLDESKEDFEEGTNGMSHVPKGSGNIKTK